jgi:hypothetical protein
LSRAEVELCELRQFLLKDVDDDDAMLRATLAKDFSVSTIAAPRRPCGSGAVWMHCTKGKIVIQ